MITLPRPTREVVPRPTREVVPRHSSQGTIPDVRNAAKAATSGARRSSSCPRSRATLPLTAGKPLRIERPVLTSTSSTPSSI